MKTGTRIARFASDRPKAVTAVIAFLAGAFVVLAALPSLWPDSFPMLHGVPVDTDPENMLSGEEPVRVFHDEMKRLLSLNDMVVVGVVNDTHPEGVFNQASLTRIHELTEYAKTLRGPGIGAGPDEGVVTIDIIAPSTVDNIEQAGLGTVSFEWLMREPPESEPEALAVRDKALNLPFLNGTLVSEDGKAIALYLPLTSKDLSHAVYKKLNEKIASFDGGDQWHITGLPVAEDTFGVEMFKQMAVSAPLAMAVIFLLMLLFFRKPSLILSPMIIALVSVIYTMGLLIVTGRTVHIMSSMIPIFIMPIAVLDSIHILSKFFDRYQVTKDRRKTIEEVMDTLFTPMLYTSLTSMAGFASLALTPIPPVQVFGLYVAFGIMAAWVLTITFIPAFVMFIPERSLANFGAAAGHADEAAAHGITGRVLRAARTFTYNRAKLILAGAALAIAVAAYGIAQIQINDNPTNWFKASHPIRVADRVLNKHFGGTYMAYLALTAPKEGETPRQYLAALKQRMSLRAEGLGQLTPEAAAVVDTIEAKAEALASSGLSPEALLEDLSAYVAAETNSAEDDQYLFWDTWGRFLDEEQQRNEVFKQPEALEYIARIEDYLATTGVVGKSNSLTGIVKTVHRELFEGEAEAYRVPETSRAVAQTLITFESSHRPHDLYHFVTPDYRTSSIWVQLKSGDNRDMSRVVSAMDEYMATNPPPFNLDPAWFGLTYINVVWQEKMVSGMLEAFLGSFLVVLLMMIVLFRSGLWGLMCMIPLTITIGLIYGIIGLIGKDYDMPVAVLSSLTLGLAVDFAIHFLARARSIHETEGNWEATHQHVFGEPARAITRNVIVIAVGFLPLLAAPLVPYITVGVFLASILLVSGAGTLLLLPAIIRYGRPWLFPRTRAEFLYNRLATCVLAAAATTGLVIINAVDFLGLRGTPLAALALLSALGTASLCWFLSQRNGARSELPDKRAQGEVS